MIEAIWSPLLPWQEELDRRGGGGTAWFDGYQCLWNSLSLCPCVSTSYFCHSSTARFHSRQGEIMLRLGFMASLKDTSASGFLFLWVGRSQFWLLGLHWGARAIPQRLLLQSPVCHFCSLVYLLVYKWNV